MSPLESAIVRVLEPGKLPMFRIIRALPEYSPGGIRGTVVVMTKCGHLRIDGTALRDDGSYRPAHCYALQVAIVSDAPQWLYPHVATFAPDLILGVRDHRPSWN